MRTRVKVFVGNETQATSLFLPTCELSMCWKEGESGERLSSRVLCEDIRSQITSAWSVGML